MNMQMNIQEKVFLPSFKQVSKIQDAANLFAQQYGSVHAYIRGNVLDANNILHHLTDWYTIAAMNANLNLIGVGDMSRNEETFYWVCPTDDGEILLTTLQTEAIPQKA